MIVKILPNMKNVTDIQKEKRKNEKEIKKNVRQTLDFSRFLCRNPVTKDNRVNKSIKTKKVKESYPLKVDIQIKRQVFSKLKTLGNRKSTSSLNKNKKQCLPINLVNYERIKKLFLKI